MLASPEPSRLSPGARPAALAALAERRFDVLVVGGGVTGAGVALDAASRGLRVALVERGDFACGTSSRSSKLIHGGLRYLEQRDLGLVREALAERRLLLTRTAPHLVRPVPFLLPLPSRRARAYLGAGVALYDALGGRGGEVPRHRHLGRRAALAAAPSLRPEGLVGALRYSDAQTDDARLALVVLRTALAHGAVAVSRAAVTGFLGRDRVEGVELRDRETGAALEARARVTVLAAGVWASGLETLAGAAAPIGLRMSKGVHLLVPRDRLELECALIVRTERSVLLVLPWGAHWLVGTTDTPWDGDADAPAASAADVDYLLATLNRSLRRPLARGDVTAVFAGLRPLVDSGAADTAALSRGHVVREPRPGLVSVAGGKLTTYRVMAAAAVDAAARALGGGVPASRTAGVPLLGAAGGDAARAELLRIGLPPEAAERLVRRYGGLAAEVGAPAAADAALAAPLPGGEPYLRAEALYAATHEGALGLEDVLARRTRIAIEAPDGGRAAAADAAALVAAPLGWSPRRVRDEVLDYGRRADAERAALAPLPEAEPALAARS